MSKNKKSYRKKSVKKKVKVSNRHKSMKVKRRSNRKTMRKSLKRTKRTMKRTKNMKGGYGSALKTEKTRGEQRLSRNARIYRGFYIV